MPILGGEETNGVAASLGSSHNQSSTTPLIIRVLIEIRVDLEAHPNTLGCIPLWSGIEVFSNRFNRVFGKVLRADRSAFQAASQQLSTDFIGQFEHQPFFE